MDKARTIRNQALAYRNWAYATPREWNVSVIDIAEHLSTDDDQVTQQRATNICRSKGWLPRLRSVGLGDSFGKPASNQYAGRHLARELAGDDTWPA